MEITPVMNGLACSGLRVGRSLVPPFHVGPGEIVEMIFPMDLASEMHRVASALCQGRGDGVRAAGAIVVLESPTTRSWLLEAIHRQTAAEWFAARSGMTPRDAGVQLQGVDLNPDVPISTLAGMPRWLIGFLAAIHKRPAALIFGTAGLDPNGIRTALAAANEQLHDAGGVYLTCFPDVPVQQPQYAAVLEVTACEPEPVMSEKSKLI